MQTAVASEFFADPAGDQQGSVNDCDELVTYRERISRSDQASNSSIFGIRMTPRRSMHTEGKSA